MQTLADRIREFSRVRLKRASVKVPKLDAKEKVVKQRQEKKPSNLSSIVNILVKAAIEKVKKAKKEKTEEKSYKIIPEERGPAAGGYGTVSRNYGAAPKPSYVDYGKIFSYLGKFKAQNSYEDSAQGHMAAINRALEDSGFALVSQEAMDKGAWRTKYYNGGWDLNSLSHVPKAGMSSAEWEQFKLWMKLDPVMYRLKSTIS